MNERHMLDRNFMLFQVVSSFKIYFKYLVGNQEKGDDVQEFFLSYASHISTRQLLSPKT